MDCVIRNAKEEDFDSVNRIMNQVQQMHVEWRPDIYRYNDEMITVEMFHEIVSGDTFYVAEINGQVAGVLEIVFRHTESPAHISRDVVFVDTMAIDENYRGCGIGHRFFEKVKEIKREKDLDGIELQVNARNRMAYEMYTKYGFTEKSINMELL